MGKMSAEVRTSRLHELKRHSANERKPSSSASGIENSLMKRMKQANTRKTETEFVVSHSTAPQTPFRPTCFCTFASALDVYPVCVDHA